MFRAVCNKWVSWWLATLGDTSRVNDDDNGEGKHSIEVNTSELAKRLCHCEKYLRPHRFYTAKKVRKREDSFQTTQQYEKL